MERVQLIGSEKQINWAEGIRENVLKLWEKIKGFEGLDEYLKESIKRGRKGVSFEEVKNFIAKMDEYLYATNNKASDWIGSFESAKDETAVMSQIKNTEFRFVENSEKAHEAIKMLSMANKKMETRGTLTFRR